MQSNVYQNIFRDSNLKKRLSRGCFGANDVYSVVHEEVEAEEAKPIAVAHTHQSSSSFCLSMGTICWRRFVLQSHACEHAKFFPTSSLMSSCSPNLCRRSKWGSLGKGGRTYMVSSTVNILTLHFWVKAHLRYYTSFPRQKSLSLFHSSAARSMIIDHVKN